MAERLGVSVGAVSKWEIGHNMPDLTVLVDMANLFDISVDVLLGYEPAAQRKDEIIDEIRILMGQHQFEEAEEASRTALIRYPNDFALLYSSAILYKAAAMEHNNPEEAQKSINLYERAKVVIAQNENPEINEFVIDSGIAANYMVLDNKKALEAYKKINFGGAHNTMLSLVSLRDGDAKAALSYGTYGLIDHLSNLFNSGIYMIVALSQSSKSKDLDSALELADTMINILDMFKAVPIGYNSKLEAVFIILKAYIYSCLGDTKHMKKAVREGKTLAQKYDDEGSTANIGEYMKFFYLDNKMYGTMDSIGQNAVKGIDRLIKKNLMEIVATRKKAIEQLYSEWEKCDI